MATVKERVLEYERFKESVIDHILQNEDLDSIFMCKGEKGFSRRMLADEIKLGTPDGLETLSSMILLSIDLVSRGRENTLDNKVKGV